MSESVKSKMDKRLEIIRRGRQRVIMTALKQSAERVIKEAKLNTPVDYGRLRAGYERTEVQSTGNEFYIEVSNPVHYGWYIEHGALYKQTRFALFEWKRGRYRFVPYGENKARYKNWLKSHVAGTGNPKFIAGMIKPRKVEGKKMLTNAVENEIKTFPSRLRKLLDKFNQKVGA